MREFFSQFGKVVDSTVMLDRETGRSKGFGFVSFEDTDVTPFLGFGNLEIDGKLVCVCVHSSFLRAPFLMHGDRSTSSSLSLGHSVINSRTAVALRVQGQVQLRVRVQVQVQAAARGTTTQGTIRTPPYPICRACPGTHHSTHRRSPRCTLACLPRWEVWPL